VPAKSDLLEESKVKLCMKEYIADSEGDSKEEEDNLYKL